MAVPNLYQPLVKITYLGDAKAPRLNDRNQVNIKAIWTWLRSWSRVSFRAGQKSNFEVVWVWRLVYT